MPEKTINSARHTALAAHQVGPRRWRWRKRPSWRWAAAACRPRTAGCPGRLARRRAGVGGGDAASELSTAAGVAVGCETMEWSMMGSIGTRATRAEHELMHVVPAAWCRNAGECVHPNERLKIGQQQEQVTV